MKTCCNDQLCAKAIGYFSHTNMSSPSSQTVRVIGNQLPVLVLILVFLSVLFCCWWRLQRLTNSQCSDMYVRFLHDTSSQSSQFCHGPLCAIAEQFFLSLDNNYVVFENGPLFSLDCCNICFCQSKLLMGCVFIF